jgi:hypothetical protein
MICSVAWNVWQACSNLRPVNNFLVSVVSPLFWYAKLSVGVDNLFPRKTWNCILTCLVILNITAFWNVIRGFRRNLRPPTWKYQVLPKRWHVYQPTRCHIPEERSHHSHCGGKLVSRVLSFSFPPEEYRPLKCDAVYSGRRSPMFTFHKLVLFTFTLPRFSSRVHASCKPECRLILRVISKNK